MQYSHAGSNRRSHDFRRSRHWHPLTVHCRGQHQKRPALRLSPLQSRWTLFRKKTPPPFGHWAYSDIFFVSAVSQKSPFLSVLCHLCVTNLSEIYSRMVIDITGKRSEPRLLNWGNYREESTPSVPGCCIEKKIFLPVHMAHRGESLLYATGDALP